MSETFNQRLAAAFHCAKNQRSTYAFFPLEPSPISEHLSPP